MGGCDLWLSGKIIRLQGFPKRSSNQRAPPISIYSNIRHPQDIKSRQPLPEEIPRKTLILPKWMSEFQVLDLSDQHMAISSYACNRYGSVTNASEAHAMFQPHDGVTFISVVSSL